MEITNTVKELISQLSQDLSIMEVWLIGSRASDSAHVASDWDLLVFSTIEPRVTASRIDGVDIIWKGPSGNVLLEGQPISHQFKFSDFNWLVTSENQATYLGKKFNDVPDGIRDASIPLQSKIKGKAICLWRR
ncbi:nucleotidyltransferase domain-containing protein [Rheinheimera sp.]|uniref:nucleotidyltransferase domain-containing protein n=1 Tax=Rheinheimera sp. TaxID=1869214 RepID=UPI00263978F8|nr:nucleotidyltransferase domain-containing protein [Rheinheimera sp.]MCA1929111.1 nucleotidyltransferase domain-containing protein [Rheinheimera sp.]